MSILDFFTRGRRSAPVARERLQVLLAHDRGLTGGGADLAAVLRQEILEVIARHIPIDRDRVMVKLDRGDQVSTLEIDIEVPETVFAGGRARSGAARIMGTGAEPEPSRGDVVRPARAARPRADGSQARR